MLPENAGHQTSDRAGRDLEAGSGGEDLSPQPKWGVSVAYREHRDQLGPIGCPEQGHRSDDPRRRVHESDQN